MYCLVKFELVFMKVSVGVVTRNRAKDLNECLESLVCSREHIFELLVVDNDSEDDTKKVVKSYKKKLPIKYLHEKKVGYSYAYNKVLNEAEGDVVAFIDDDCVAGENWVEEVVFGFKKYKNVSAVVGRSINYYSSNPFSCVVSAYNKVWLESRVGERGEVFDYSVLDNKNIAFRVKKLRLKGLMFDEELGKRVGGGRGEDCDLGIHLEKLGMEARFCKRMIVEHKEPKSLKGLLKSAYYSGLVKSRYLFDWKKFLDSKKELGLKTGLLEKKRIRKKLDVLRREGKELSLEGWLVYLVGICLHKASYLIGRVEGVLRVRVG